MDAFAVAICTGLAMTKVNIKKAFIVGLYFGIFQAGMPLMGFFTANLFAEKITAFSDLIAFALLVFLGVKMVIDSFKKDSGTNENTISGEDSDPVEKKKEASLKPSKMLPLAVATSIDALAVGVSFSLLRVNIYPAVTIIGITTLVISFAGVIIGNLFGVKYKSKAQLAGGIILIAMGIYITT